MPSALRKRSYSAAAGWLILAAFAAIAIFADFFAPYDYSRQSRSEPSAPATRIHFYDADGAFSLRPVVHAQRLTDPLRLTYTEDQSRAFPIGLLVRGHSYDLLGLIETKIHLFGVVDDTGAAPRINLLGTDALGRDRFSRLLQAVRFSLVVCTTGVALACLIGIFVGVISGYSSRIIDTALMGTTDAMLALPTLILILAARTAFPLDLPPLRAAFLLLLIFALTGWADMGRLTRGLVLSMRGREFVLAAVASGLTQTRILLRHILPNISRPLSTQALLMLPTFLLAEVAMSYLGVGLQEPEPSLGNMLAAAGDLNQLRSQSLTVLSPAVVIFVFVFGIHLAAKREGRRDV